MVNVKTLIICWHLGHDLLAMKLILLTKCTVDGYKCINNIKRTMPASAILDKLLCTPGAGDPAAPSFGGHNSLSYYALCGIHFYYFTRLGTIFC